MSVGEGPCSTPGTIYLTYLCKALAHREQSCMPGVEEGRSILG